MTSMLSALARPVLLVALGGARGVALAAAAAKPGPVTVYVGTYTDGHEPRDLPSRLRSHTGAVTEPVLAVETKEPVLPRPPPERPLPLCRGRGLELPGREEQGR